MSRIVKAHQAIMPQQHDATLEMHKAVYRFWQAQIEKSKECYNEPGCIKMLWERRVENASRGLHNFSAGIMRDYGSEYLEVVAQPEWFEFLDLL